MGFMTSTTLSSDEIDEAIKLLINQLQKDKPALKPLLADPKQREQLIDCLKKVLENTSPNLTKQDLFDQEFLKKLVATSVTAMTLTNNPFIKDKKLLEKLRKLILDPKNSLDLKLNPALLKERVLDKLSPQELKQLQNEIKDSCREILKNLEKSGFKLPTPKPGQKSEDEMAKNFDRYENLFSLMLSAVTGSLPSVVQCFAGNGLGFPDMNPNAGLAPIDDQTKTTSPFGDPRGDHSKTAANFSKMLGDPFVEDYHKKLGEEQLSQSNTPRFTPSTGGHPK